MYVVHILRSPFETTSIVGSCRASGSGGININGSLIGDGSDKGIWPITDRSGRISYNAAITGTLEEKVLTDRTKGRFPANVLLAGVEQPVEAQLFYRVRFNV